MKTIHYHPPAIKTLPILATLLLAAVAPTAQADEKSGETAILSLAGARALVEISGGMARNADGEWELRRHWVGEMKTVIGTPPNKYANLAVPVRFDIIGPVQGQLGKVALSPSDHSSLSDVIIFYDGLPAIDDLKDPAKASEILIRLWPLLLSKPDDKDRKTLYGREWNLFAPALGNQLHVLCIEGFIADNDRRKGKLEPKNFTVREGFFRLSDPANPKDRADYPSVKMRRSSRQAVVDATETPRQGEWGDFTEWKKYTYEIKSDYPHVKSLPKPEAIPSVIAYLEKKGDEGGIPLSQLECLTRMSFNNQHETDSLRAHAYRKWWEGVGEEYFRRVETEGQRSPEAWTLLVGDAPIHCPDYKILIPPEWHFEIRFRTGDYMGVQQEIIRMERKKDSAALIRSFSTATGKPFQHESWHGFKVEEADRFLRALTYAVDQPWLVKRLLESSPEADNKKLAVPDRTWHSYYGGSRWTGVRYPDGRVWWNDDPSNWYYNGLYPTRQFSDTCLSYYNLVYPFLCHHYPEKRSNDGSPGWEVSMTPFHLDEVKE
jgi:hypothetical protein